jgi:arylsulfatase A-like enzyme
MAALLGARAVAADPLNFVVLLTDDQRFDTLWAMPILEQELGTRGVTFTDALVTTPLCCPSRSSLLSGGFTTKSHGVRNNEVPNGRASRFPDAVSLATRLQGAGYATALIGKYMNGYDELQPYVPPGWNLWRGSFTSTLIPFRHVIGSSGATASQGVLSPQISQNGTEWLRDRALEFIDAHLADPFFLYLAIDAPHYPATALPQDEGLFADYLFRERGYGEDVSDKPPRVQVANAQFPAIAESEDEFHRKQLRSLQAVDRAVGTIVQRLIDRGLLDRTMIVYTSDNGFLWGEHGLVGKSESYEESIRVPLVVVAPGTLPRVDDRWVAADVDVPATILDLSGVGGPTEGVSFAAALTDPQAPERSSVVSELSLNHRSWATLRLREPDGDWKFVEDSRFRRELYHLTSDPYELTNVASDPARQGRIAGYAAQLAPQKALAVTTTTAPAGVAGHSYGLTIGVWGGTPPYTWSVAGSGLAPGLSLAPSTGILSGVPLREEVRTVLLQVRDSSVGPLTGQSQLYQQPLTLTFRGSCQDGIDNDRDGLTDMVDPGCAAPSDDSEHAPNQPCDDGIDNDGDGRSDAELPLGAFGDLGCGSAFATTESPACQDGLDNDGDGAIDFDGGLSAGGPGGPPDPQCPGASGTRETPGGCGPGFELALILPALTRLRSARSRPRSRG